MDSTTYAATVAANIKTEMNNKGRSVLSVAEATGIPRSTLLRRFNSEGMSAFTVREIKAIADDLGTTALALATVYTQAEKVPA